MPTGRQPGVDYTPGAQEHTCMQTLLGIVERRHSRDEDVKHIASHAPYFLAKQVFCGVVGQTAVLLDLRQDRYLTIPCRSLQAVGIDVLAQSTVTSVEPTGPADIADGENIARTLLLQRLITTDRDASNPIVPTQLQAAQQALWAFVGDDPLTWPRQRRNRQYLKSIFVAATAALLCLKYCAFERVISGWMEVRRHCVGDLRNVNLEACANVVSTFEHYRPLIPHRYLCLFDSLALLRVLAGRQQYPHWVFGVQTDPFLAHCWIQWEDVVLNDSVEEIRTYTPIMVV